MQKHEAYRDQGKAVSGPFNDARRVPIALLADVRLSLAAKGAACHIWAAVALSKEDGFSQAEFSNAMQELIAAGWIEIDSDGTVSLYAEARL